MGNEKPISSDIDNDTLKMLYNGLIYAVAVTDVLSSAAALFLCMKNPFFSIRKLSLKGLAAHVLFRKI